MLIDGGYCLDKAKNRSVATQMLPQITDLHAFIIQYLEDMALCFFGPASKKPRHMYLSSMCFRELEKDLLGIICRDVEMSGQPFVAHALHRNIVSIGALRRVDLLA